MKRVKDDRIKYFFGLGAHTGVSCLIPGSQLRDHPQYSLGNDMWCEIQNQVSHMQPSYPLYYLSYDYKVILSFFFFEGARLAVQAQLLFLCSEINPTGQRDYMKFQGQNLSLLLARQTSAPQCCYTQAPISLFIHYKSAFFRQLEVCEQCIIIITSALQYSLKLEKVIFLYFLFSQDSFISVAISLRK